MAYTAPASLFNSRRSYVEELEAAGALLVDRALIVEE